MAWSEFLCLQQHQATNPRAFSSPAERSLGEYCDCQPERELRHHCGKRRRVSDAGRNKNTGMITDITREDQLKSMQGLNLPILIAQYWYSQHSSLNFVQDLNHYLHEGQVLSTQGVFVMGKVVSIAGEPTFFVRFATGKMKDLVQHLPHYVGWIAFCR